MIGKILYFIFFSAISIGTLSAQKISASATTHEFGKISAGKAYTHEFAYTNTGDSPLIILSVGAQCKCTKTKWSKKPLKPGESEKITATFSSKDKGLFIKEIKIISNAGKNIFIIKGDVQ